MIACLVTLVNHSRLNLGKRPSLKHTLESLISLFESLLADLTQPDGLDNNNSNT